MTESAACGLLKFVIANPDDDAPRLVFADWLEEHGDADRAEFIRVQCERARLPDWDARQVRLRLREAALLRHEPQWRAELPAVAGVKWGGFRRGFVAEAEFRGFAALRAGASECWAAAPVEAVALPCPGPADGADGLAPVVGLRELKLTTPGVRGGVRRLADSPLLSTLRRLDAGGFVMGAALFRRLVASPHLRRLAALAAPSNNLGDGGVDALVGPAAPASLTELDLSETGDYGRGVENSLVTAGGAAALAAWPWAARLRTLNLSGNDLRRGGLRALLASPHFAVLRSLTLRGCGLDGPAVEELCAATPGLRPESLDLRANAVGDAGAAWLARAGCLGGLKSLRLDRCGMSADGARALAGAAFADSLCCLDVGDNSLGADGLRVLLERWPRQLHTLGLVGNSLGDEGAGALAAAPSSDGLLALDLDRNGLGGSAVRALAGSPHLQNLRVLRCKVNPIGGAAWDELAASPLGRRLALTASGRPGGFTD